MFLFQTSFQKMFAHSLCVSLFADYIGEVTFIAKRRPSASIDSSEIEQHGGPFLINTDSFCVFSFFRDSIPSQEFKNRNLSKRNTKLYKDTVLKHYLMLDLLLIL